MHLARSAIKGVANSGYARPHHVLKYSHVHHTASNLQDATNPLFCYTSGRWLWNEREQLKSRCRRFDVSSLEEAACRAVGANKCISFKKIGEGNCNKAYRLEMDDGQKVIAKVPHPNAGPRTLTTASEVAAMDFARNILGIPVPKVLAWSATDQNPVQAEYIIMEEAKGSQLHGVWQDLALRTKGDVIREIVDIEQKLLSVSFDKVGSLYFKDSEIAGCEPATVTDGLRDDAERIESRYCIGPITRRECLAEERRELPYHGPWSSSVEYLQSLATREIDWISDFANTENTNRSPWQYWSPKQESPQAHRALLQKFLLAIPHIVPKDPKLIAPRLWHPDFHTGNIYIDSQAHISSVIDWQGSWTTPVFIGANPPLLLDYNIEMLMKLPDNFKQLDEATQQRLRYQVSQSILIHIYETTTAEKNPLMYAAMRLPHGKTLKQLEAFAGSTWDGNCLYPFEECLISVEKEWEHFDTDTVCPYHLSDEQVRRHYEDAEIFNKSQEFWERLRGVVTDEGYALNETFEQAVEVFKNLRDVGLEGLEGEERIEFDEESRWIEDLKV